MKKLICFLFIGSTLITGCSFNKPGLAFTDAEQTIQGPVSLIEQADFTSIYLPGLLDPSLTPDSYIPGAIDTAFKTYNTFNKEEVAEAKCLEDLSSISSCSMRILRRNKIQERLLAASEQSCGEYQNFLKKYDSEFNFLMGTLTTATAAAGAIVTGGGSNILAGIASAFSGIRAEGNDAMLASKAVEIITNGIDLKREQIYEKIVTNREKGLIEYPVERAIKDAIFYHANCSLVAGLEQADNSIERERDIGISTLITNMDKLKKAFIKSPELKEMVNDMTEN